MVGILLLNFYWSVCFQRRTWVVLLSLNYLRQSWIGRNDGIPFMFSDLILNASARAPVDVSMWDSMTSGYGLSGTGSATN
jgi:hypothetical protein